MAALDLRTRYGADYDFFMGHGGFSPVPPVLINSLSLLGLEVQEIAMLQFMIHDFYMLNQEIRPLSALAVAMNLSVRQARHWRSLLREKGLISVFNQPGRPSLVDLSPLVAAVKRKLGYETLQEAAAPAAVEEVVAEQDHIDLALVAIAAQFKEELRANDKARRQMIQAAFMADWADEQLLLEMQQAAFAISKQQYAHRRWSVFFKEMDRRVKLAQRDGQKRRDLQDLYDLEAEQQRALWEEDNPEKALAIGIQIQEWQERHKPGPLERIVTTVAAAALPI